jgi:integrase
VTHVRVRGFKIFTDRHGKPRCYHRKTGIAVDLAANPIGSAGFLAECARIVAFEDKGQKAKPGTLGLLIERYRGHAAFMDLSDRTKTDYLRVIDYLKPIADTPLTWFTPPRIVRIRDKAAEDKGRRFGNYTKAVLSVAFGWGVERGYLASNPAFKVKDIRKPRNAPEANRPWSDAERHAVLAAAPPHIKLPVALMMFTGIDPQDAVRLPRSAISAGAITLRRKKTGVPVSMPLLGELRAILDESPSHSAVTICATSYGTPWTLAGLRASWRKVRMKLEETGEVAPGLTLKGLRHTVATILAEMDGIDERTIADVLGQETIEMARHYSRRADKSRRVTGVVEKFDAEVNRRRTEVVKPA